MGNIQKAPEPLSSDGNKSEKYTGSLLNNKLSVDDFDLLTVVGRGSFGKVFQVRKKDTGNIYAMKVLKKKALVARKQVAHTKTERKVLEQIDHPFIVCLRFAFQTEAKLYMVLDYFNGGELFYHLSNEGRFKEPRVKFYIAEIVLALQCLHENNIIYRDLKPENILLDHEGHIRLTDFGLSKESLGNNLTHTFCGTPEYLAPEVLENEGYGKEVDWWSLGALMFEMLTGLPPFYNENRNVMYEKILYGKVKYPKYISRECRELMEALLTRKASERLGAGGAKEVKAHKFFKDIDWDLMLQKKVKTPFVPKILQGQLDISNIDDEFKNEVVQDTPMPESNLNVSFSQFSFNPEKSNIKNDFSQLNDAEHGSFLDSKQLKNILEDEFGEES